MHIEMMKNEAAKSIALPAPPASRRPQRRAWRPASILQVMTLVLWLGCWVVGIIGLRLHYRWPIPAAKPPELMQAELMTVQVTQDPTVLADALPPSPDLDPPPPPVPAAAAPAAPALAAVAEPAPAIAFALPVEGPTQKVDAPHADFARPAATTAPASGRPAAPAVQRLTYGQGEGAQPAPDYPPDAIAAGEEGVVGIRFTVGEDGRVIDAHVVSPSRWPSLNSAALRVIQNRWRLTPGAARTFEVSIRFHINR